VHRGIFEFKKCNLECREHRVLSKCPGHFPRSSQHWCRQLPKQGFNVDPAVDGTVPSFDFAFKVHGIRWPFRRQATPRHATDAT
jgi:hypothetical protein